MLRDNQTERARALLLEMAGDLDEVEATRFSAMIDAHDGVDPRERLERAYHDTGSIIDLQNLVGYLQESDDRWKRSFPYSRSWHCAIGRLRTQGIW